MITRLSFHITVFTVGVGLAGNCCAAAAGAAAPHHAPDEFWLSAAPAEPVIPSGQSAPSADSKKPESVKAPVQPAPAESRTPEEATKRAADPKDPSGALIIEPPSSTPAKTGR
jgi:hypothetical protein